MNKYVIQDLVHNGYWSDSHEDFKGLVFSSRYDSISDAENIIYNNNLTDCTIISIY